MKPPFPWFGGKSRVAPLVWERFGVVRNYVEPFAGSLAVLFGRPQPFDGTETVNDADGLLCNFWRALQAKPAEVARYADNPVNENDLHARHSWLVERRDKFVRQLEGDPGYFDAKVAGWWVWGLCCWIGSGWCSGKGPWQVVKADDGTRQLVHLGNAGRGVNRQLVHLGNAGRGVNRKRVAICEYMEAIAERLSGVRVCCGDWRRVCGGLSGNALRHFFSGGGNVCAVFLDPPYSHEERCPDLYRVEKSIADDVRAWALEHGDDPQLRIALCGYEGEHRMPKSWQCVPWKAAGGYGSQGKNRGRENAGRERIWFSPHCLSKKDVAAARKIGGAA